MTSPKPNAEEMARRLQSTLQRRRLKPTVIVLTALVLAVCSLVIFVWFIYPRAEGPPLQVVALDTALSTGGPNALARVATLSDDSSLTGARGQTVVFLTPDGSVAPQTTSTNDDGFAAAPLAHQRLDFAEFYARHVDGRGRQTMDRGRAFVWDKHSRVVLVEAEILADLPAADWDKAAPANVALKAGVSETLGAWQKDGAHLAYLVLSTTAARKVRTWLEGRFQATPAVPLGPVIQAAHFSAREPASLRQSAANMLLQWFSDVTAVVAEEAAAADYRGTGVSVRLALK